MARRPPDRPPLHVRAPVDERQPHPTSQAIWLLVGVTALIVLLAALSSSGQI